MVSRPPPNPQGHSLAVKKYSSTIVLLLFLDSPVFVSFFLLFNIHEQMKKYCDTGGIRTSKRIQRIGSSNVVSLFLLFNIAEQNKILRPCRDSNLQRIPPMISSPSTNHTASAEDNHCWTDCSSSFNIDQQLTISVTRAGFHPLTNTGTASL